MTDPDTTNASMSTPENTTLLREIRDSLRNLPDTLVRQLDNSSAFQATSQLSDGQRRDPQQRGSRQEDRSPGSPWSSAAPEGFEGSSKITQAMVVLADLADLGPQLQEAIAELTGQQTARVEEIGQPFQGAEDGPALSWLWDRGTQEPSGFREKVEPFIGPPEKKGGDLGLDIKPLEVPEDASPPDEPFVGPQQPSGYGPGDWGAQSHVRSELERTGELPYYAQPGSGMAQKALEGYEGPLAPVVEPFPLEPPSVPPAPVPAPAEVALPEPSAPTTRLEMPEAPEPSVSTTRLEMPELPEPSVPTTRLDMPGSPDPSLPTTRLEMPSLPEPSVPTTRLDMPSVEAPAPTPSTAEDVLPTPLTLAPATRLDMPELPEPLVPTTRLDMPDIPEPVIPTTRLEALGEMPIDPSLSVDRGSAEPPPGMPDESLADAFREAMGAGGSGNEPEGPGSEGLKPILEEMLREVRSMREAQERILAVTEGDESERAENEGTRTITGPSFMRDVAGATGGGGVVDMLKPSGSTVKPGVGVATESSPLMRSLMKTVLKKAL